MKPTDPLVAHIHDLARVNGTVCQFFSRRPLWGQQRFYSEEQGFPSYTCIRGEGATEIPEGVYISEGQWPVYNAEARDRRKAIGAAERLGRKILSSEAEEDLRVVSRDFMVAGTTLPIRVDYEISRPAPRKASGKNARMESVYVKQMHLNRLTMGVLYHLAMGREYPMFFSESTVTERETAGPTLTQAYRNDPKFLSRPQVKRELAKLATVAHFLSLDDMDNGENVIVDARGRFDVIDFDKAFWERAAHPEEQLINPFSYELRFCNGQEPEIIALPDEKLMRHFRDGELNVLVRKAMREIHGNVERHRRLFEGIVDLMDSIPYYRTSVQRLYGDCNVRKFFRKRRAELKAA